MMRSNIPLAPDNRAYALILAHCTYTLGGIRKLVLCDLPRLLPPTPHLATATIVQRGQVLAGMMFRCDLPLDDPYLPALIDRLIVTAPALQALLESDPGRALVVEPVHHRPRQSLCQDAAACREVFLHAFLRHAAAGAA